MSGFDESTDFRPGERIALFIDGANVYGSTRSLEFDIDFSKLRRLFARKALLVRAYYYTALPGEQVYSPVRPLIDWLQYNGYSMVTKPMKEFVDAAGNRKVKGNMDIELAVDAMEMSAHLDHIVLMSGDGDFRRLVDALQKRGKRVTVVSTARTQPSMIADDLRRQADFFVDLADMREEIARPALAGQGQTGAAERPPPGPAPYAKPGAARPGEISNDYIEGIDPDRPQAGPRSAPEVERPRPAARTPAGGPRPPRAAPRRPATSRSTP